MDPKREAHFFCFNSRGPAFSSMPPVRRIFPKFSGGLVSTDVDNVIKNPVILNDMVGAVQKVCVCVPFRGSREEERKWVWHGWADDSDV